MKKTIISASILAVGFSLMGGTVQATPIIPTVSFDSGKTLNTTGLSTFTTAGSDMVGTKVTAFFSDGSSDSATWAVTTTPAGAATGIGWSLTFAGTTTFSPFWELLNSTTGKTLTSFIIDGQLGSTIFDTILDPVTTPGSARGTAFSGVDGPSGLIVDAVYRNQVALNNIVYGDLYTVLDVDFGGTPGGLVNGERLRFTADTDNTLIQNDLNPVPEPETLALIGFGLVGLMLSGRKSLNKK